MDEQTVTIAELRSHPEWPVLIMGDDGLTSYVSPAFCQEYAWTEEQLVGKTAAKIMPKNMEEAHTIGVSRLVSTGTPRLLRQHLHLQLTCGDGREFPVDHFIIGEQGGDGWTFAALFKPIEAAPEA